jgi:hypothetical protein
MTMTKMSEPFLPDTPPEDFNTFYRIRRKHLPYTIKTPYQIYHFQDFDVWVCSYTSYTTTGSHAGSYGKGLVAFAAIPGEMTSPVYCKHPWEKQYTVQPLPLSFPWSHQHTLPGVVTKNGDLYLTEPNESGFVFMSLVTILIFYGFENVYREVRDLQQVSALSAEVLTKEYYQSLQGSMNAGS